MLSYIKFLSVSYTHMLLKETRDWQGDFTRNHKQAEDPPGSLHTTVFVGGVKLPQVEGSAVIHHTALQLHDFSTLA